MSTLCVPAILDELEQMHQQLDKRLQKIEEAADRISRIRDVVEKFLPEEDASCC